jgi:hypothetical protein
VTTDEDLLSTLLHPQLAWNTPLSISHADRLLASLEPSHGSRFVDLGCGWGGLLLRALTATPRSTGLGVDRNPAYLDRAVRAARGLGLSERVRFARGDITRFRVAGDRLICIGADHAWGRAGAALAHLTTVIESGGRLLFGCGFWTRRPSPELVEVFGELPESFEAVLALPRSSGWTLHSADSADLTEWDDFETTWRQDLEEIGAREPRTDLGRQALRLSARRQEEYEGGYRGVLGFAYLILERREGQSRGASTE